MNAFPLSAEGGDRPVFAAFPEYQSRMRLLLDADEDFRELCADFDVVVHAYERGAHPDSGSSGTADEFHSLRIEIESEILSWLRRGYRPTEL